jgi:hypothetical protein
MYMPPMRKEREIEEKERQTFPCWSEISAMAML